MGHKESSKNNKRFDRLIILIQNTRLYILVLI